MTRRNKKGREGDKVVGSIKKAKVESLALDGKNINQIAAETGLCRQTVSKILTSDEIKQKIKEIDGKLAAGIDAAIETILNAAQMDYVAARDVLRNFGSMKQTVDLNHAFPQPTVIEYSDGDKTVMGTIADIDPEGELEN